MLYGFPLAAWVNPARAGMILIMSARSSFDGGKPRASGDDPPTPGRDDNSIA